jgi:hypothetical protein
MIKNITFEDKLIAVIIRHDFHKMKRATIMRWLKQTDGKRNGMKMNYHVSYLFETYKLLILKRHKK